MHKYNKNIKSTGFTLSELLIAVAIISIIVSVSIPIFASHLISAREAACAANRRSLRALLIADYLSDGTDMKTNFEKQIANGQYPCPSGGTYSLIVSEDGSNCTVTCSLHGGTSEITPAHQASSDARAVFSDMQNLVFSIYNNSTEMAAFKKDYKYVSNDTLISYLKDNTKERTIKINDNTFVIRQCINNSALSPSLNTTDAIKSQIIIFATPKGSGGWYTGYIFNPDDSCWYTNTKGGYSVNDKSFESVKADTINNTNKKWVKVDDKEFS